MGKKKPTLGYPSQTDAIFALWENGMSRKEIGEKLNLSQDRVGHAICMGRSAWKRRILERDDEFAIRILNGDITRYFETEAKKRNVMPAELARRLLETVARDKLVNAILDDLPVEQDDAA